MERIICLVIGYLFGLFPTGKLISHIRGVDLSKVGSGNSGATNSVRAMGAKFGLLVLAGDCLKAVLACVIARFVFGGSKPEYALLYVIYAGLGTVLGHDFPVYAHFKGGKGISCTLGLLFGIWDARLFLPCMFVFLGIVAFTRYVSLASITANIVMVLAWSILNLNKMVVLADGVRLESVLVLVVIMALAIYRHKTNIGRLLAGNENKFSFKKQK